MKDVARYRAMESLCRQSAVFNPLESWRLLLAQAGDVASQGAAGNRIRFFCKPGASAATVLSQTEVPPQTREVNGTVFCVCWPLRYRRTDRNLKEHNLA